MKFFPKQGLPAEIQISLSRSPQPCKWMTGNQILDPFWDLTISGHGHEEVQEEVGQDV